MKNFWGWLLIVVICGAFWVYENHPEVIKKVTADLSWLGNDSQTAPPAPLTESDYHGTTETNFAKEWVIVGGVKLYGITRANPAPGAQVAILYSGGGKDVPAHRLPQGFLDAWNLSPQRLKAAENR